MSPRRLRRKTALTLEKMDIGVESSHHEAAPSQHEIDLRYTDALTMADNMMTFRLVVKEIAAENGCFATFMPKPLAGHNGSGMHINMSLFKKGKNAFFDSKDPDHLSEVARGFIAGLLRHARELTLFTNQWVNSYKRIVPGFEAPTRVTWAQREPRRSWCACRVSNRAAKTRAASNTARPTPPATRIWYSRS